jgi:hypothetical protein
MYIMKLPGGFWVHGARCFPLEHTLQGKVRKHQIDLHLPISPISSLDSKAREELDSLGRDL